MSVGNLRQREEEMGSKRPEVPRAGKGESTKDCIVVGLVINLKARGRPTKRPRRF